MAIEKRRGSSLEVLDTALLVFVAIIAAVVVLKVLGWIVGTVFFLVKVAVVALGVAVVVSLVSRVRRR